MKNYVQHTSYTEPEDIKRLDFIVNQIDQACNQGARVLDVGCGNGNISKALGSLGYIVTGIDISAASVEQASKHNPFENVNFKVADAEKLAETETFDAVVCSEVLEHLNEPKHLVSALQKLTADTGILVITVPNGYGPRELLVTQPIIWLEKNGFGKTIASIKRALGYANATVQSSNPDLTHIQFFTTRTLKKTIEPFGFKSVQWGKANCIEKVFPFSFLANRMKILKKWDCSLANYLPLWCTSGFYTSWTKQKS